MQKVYDNETIDSVYQLKTIVEELLKLNQVLSQSDRSLKEMLDILRQNEINSRFLTLSEAADALHCTPKRVTEVLKSRGIEIIDAGKTYEKLTLLVLYDYWIKEESFNYLSSNKVEFSQNSDFPYEFGEFDFLPTDVIDVIEFDNSSPVNFELTFWGPCVNPYIIVNGNEYRINNVELTDGEYIIVNSKMKTITKHSIDGSKSNIFNLRDSNNIFTLLPPGKSIITRQNDAQISIKLFIEKGEPIWI